jgi:hypothetical protein
MNRQFQADKPNQKYEGTKYYGTKSLVDGNQGADCAVYEIKNTTRDNSRVVINQM